MRSVWGGCGEGSLGRGKETAWQTHGLSSAKDSTTIRSHDSHTPPNMNIVALIPQALPSHKHHMRPLDPQDNFCVLCVGGEAGNKA